MLASRLKELREKRGETQTRLSELMGVNPKAVSRWEAGERRPEYDTLMRLADHYGVTTDYLLGRSPSPMVYAQPVGEIDGQAATLLTTDRVTLTNSDKAAVLASAQSPEAVVIDLGKLGLPKNREELEATVRKLIEEARGS